MATFQVLFRTQGVATSFLNTTKSIPVFLSGSQATCFLNVYAPTTVFLTSSVKETFVTTNSNASLFLTPSQKVAFFDTVDKNTPKLLKPRIGELEVASNYTNVIVPDATGNYNALTNQGGYNVLPAPYNAARPYRQNVALWTLYRVWNKYGDVTQSPESQDQQYNPNYQYQLFFPTELNAQNDLEVIKGIYEIILVAAPYFNEENTGGTFDSSSGIASNYYVVYGDETNFDASLNDDDYLYYVNPANGNLTPIGQILKVFNDTALALTATATNEPDAGAIMYGSAAAVTTTINSGGTVASYTDSSYNVVTGTATEFTTQFAIDEYVYYVDAVTGDYVEMGQILQIDTDTSLKIHNKTSNPNPSATEILMSSAAQFVLTNSGGTYDSDSGNNIYGVNTQFFNFGVGQTLYSQDVVGNITTLGVIQTIVSDTELVLSGLPITTPTIGDRLFAGDAGLVLVNSNGAFNSIGIPMAYYLLTGDGANFSGFVGQYVYIVGENLLYQELGVPDFQRTSNELIFYTPNGLIVNEGDFVIANPTQLALSEVEGVVGEYATGEYYNLVGDGTTFLTKANPEQYLFYLENETQIYRYVGQIFQVYDNTNLWLYNAAEGAPDDTTTLYTSDTLNTTTVAYNSVKGLANLYDIAVQYPGWFVTSAGLLVDEDIINCLTRMRYEFLESVMCGNCTEGYLDAYSVYVGMINAMEAGKWDVAVGFYDRLKAICSEYQTACGC